MSEFFFFDCNCMIGRSSTPTSGMPFEAGEIVRELAYCDIGEALVFHALAKEYAPAFGNERLMDEIRNRKNLHPCWVLMPHHTGEMPEPDTVVQEMRRNDVRVARMFPALSLQHFGLDEWTCGPLFRALEAHRIPLFLELDQTNWGEIHALCDRHPELPVVVCNVNYRIARRLYSLLERFEHLYVELSGYLGHRAIEAVCRRFGGGRLLFGTRMPFFTPAPPAMLVRYANISDEERRKIAGENLRDLLDDVV